MARHRYPQPCDAIPPVVTALHRHPEYFDVFPVGASLAMWATWSA